MNVATFDTYLQYALSMFALFVVFCGSVARQLPPGKAQHIFAWLGAFAVPKAQSSTTTVAIASPNTAFENTIAALADSLTPDQVSRMLASTDVNALTASQYDVLMKLIRDTSKRSPVRWPAASILDPDETQPGA